LNAGDTEIIFLQESFKSRFVALATDGDSANTGRKRVYGFPLSKICRRSINLLGMSQGFGLPFSQSLCSTDKILVTKSDVRTFTFLYQTTRQYEDQDDNHIQKNR
jgi:hypothetical protein